MATAPKDPGQPEVARVDFLIDDMGAPIEVPVDSPIKVAGEHEQSLGAAGPTNWWLYGMLGLSIVVVVLLVLQMFNGAPGSDAQPGSPTAEPVVETPAAP